MQPTNGKLIKAIKEADTAKYRRGCDSEWAEHEWDYRSHTQRERAYRLSFTPVGGGWVLSW